MMLYCSRPGDFDPCHHSDPVGIVKIGEGPYAALHCVTRRTEDGELCLVAMNAFAMPVSFEIFLDRTALQTVDLNQEKGGL